ncbi:CDP-alcohol phosphatidyltransferase family protein [Caryophanon latum]|uniref:Phosphatidylglycerophosphate synthase n=1 Tax=Caryophanon latum TaxID=33977 RepID=A0A1C0YV89_9BACL|nr:CDP-alcohol phosphatidyltransferase family protein [Caryophanon latum]OCS91056.1 CDP-alcohol phosphatidyltransferase [Caryophanon latum]
MVHLKRTAIANYISITRIVLSITLLCITPLSMLFLLVYILCGITDMLDGYIARKMHTESTFGSKLDSIADFIMMLVLMFVLLPFLPLTESIMMWIVIIGVIKVGSIVIVFIKYRTFEMLHTYSNQVVGFVLFLYPMSLYVTPSHVLLCIICMIATFAALEKLLIHVGSIVLATNRKSIFSKS